MTSVWHNPHTFGVTRCECSGGTTRDRGLSSPGMWIPLSRTQCSHGQGRPAGLGAVGTPGLPWIPGRWHTGGGAGSGTAELVTGSLSAGVGETNIVLEYSLLGMAPEVRASTSAAADDVMACRCPAMYISARVRLRSSIDRLRSTM